MFAYKHGNCSSQAEFCSAGGGLPRRRVTCGWQQAWRRRSSGASSRASSRRVSRRSPNAAARPAADAASARADSSDRASLRHSCRSTQKVIELPSTPCSVAAAAGCSTTHAQSGPHGTPGPRLVLAVVKVPLHCGQPQRLEPLRLRRQAQLVRDARLAGAPQQPAGCRPQRRHQPRPRCTVWSQAEETSEEARQCSGRTAAALLVHARRSRQLQRLSKRGIILSSPAFRLSLTMHDRPAASPARAGSCTACFQ